LDWRGPAAILYVGMRNDFPGASTPPPSRLTAAPEPV
jgi:hypothetical protein